MKKFLFAAILISLFSFAQTSAQVIPPSAQDYEDDIQYSFVPFAGYTSDLGFLGGILLQRLNYGTDSDQPFLSNIRLDATFTTKGNFSADFDYEHTRSFSTDIRSRFSLTGERNQQSNYFGIGNQTGFSSDQYEEEFYFFENRKFVLSYSGRKQVSEFGEYGILDLIFPVSFTYLNASTKAESSKFEEDRPKGTGSGWVNKTGIGVIADSRDSEFAPTRGFRYQGSLKISPSFFGSDYTFAEVKADFRHYFEIIEDLVLAQKIQADHRLGRAPFWQLSAIGNDDGLRGYHKDRFLGDSSVLHMLELRTWLFSFMEGEIRVGGQLFWDTGRVYSEFDSARFFDDWKHTWGGGAAMSVFNSDFILRGDIGISEESSRIYIGLGYVF